MHQRSELITAIINETIEAINDEENPKEFREALKKILQETDREIKRTIARYDC